MKKVITFLFLILFFYQCGSTKGSKKETTSEKTVLNPQPYVLYLDFYALYNDTLEVLNINDVKSFIKEILVSTNDGIKKYSNMANLNFGKESNNRWFTEKYNPIEDLFLTVIFQDGSQSSNRKIEIQSQFTSKVDIIFPVNDDKSLEFLERNVIRDPKGGTTIIDKPY